MKTTFDKIKYWELKKEYENCTSRLNKLLIRGDACANLQKPILKKFLLYCDKKDRAIYNKIKFARINETIETKCYHTANSYCNRLKDNLYFSNREYKINNNLITRIK